MDLLETLVEQRQTPSDCPLPLLPLGPPPLLPNPPLARMPPRQPAECCAEMPTEIGAQMVKSCHGRPNLLLR